MELMGNPCNIFTTFAAQSLFFQDLAAKVCSSGLCAAHDSIIYVTRHFTTVCISSQSGRYLLWDIQSLKCLKTSITTAHPHHPGCVANLLVLFLRGWHSSAPRACREEGIGAHSLYQEQTLALHNFSVRIKTHTRVSDRAYSFPA